MLLHSTHTAPGLFALGFCLIKKNKNVVLENNYW